MKPSFAVNRGLCPVDQTHDVNEKGDDGFFDCYSCDTYYNIFLDLEGKNPAGIICTRVRTMPDNQRAWAEVRLTDAIVEHASFDIMAYELKRLDEKLDKFHASKDWSSLT